MAIYFIRAGESGPVKIGRTNNVRRRMQMLQTGSAAKLEILHVFAGGEPEEKELHQRFEGVRLVGEWFEPSPEILSGDVGLLAIKIDDGLQKNGRRKRHVWSQVSRSRFSSEAKARWADPAWSAAERMRRKENGPQLSLLHHQREMSRLLNAADLCRRQGNEDGAAYCEVMADRHEETLKTKFGIPRERLRPDLFERPAREVVG